MSETEDEAEGVSLDEANLTPKNWTIKNVPPSVRLIANASATKKAQSMGQWITDAVHAHAKQQGGNLVLPPRPTRANNATFEGQPAAMVGVNGHLSDLAALVQMAVILSPDGKRTQALSVARAAVMRRLKALDGD